MVSPCFRLPALARVALTLGLGASIASAGSLPLVAPPTKPSDHHEVKLPAKARASSKVTCVVALSPASAGPGEIVQLTIATTIHPGWHVSALGKMADDVAALPTVIEFDAVGLDTTDGQFVPSVEPHAVKVGDATHLQHKGKVTWTQTFRVAEGATSYSGIGTFEFQACDDSMCLPPTTWEFSLASSEKPDAASVTPMVDGHVRRGKISYPTIGEPITVELGAADLKRSLVDTSGMITADPKEDMDTYIEQLTASFNATEPLPIGGTFERQGEKVSIYLAKEDSYELENAANGETKYENTASYLSIDQDGDGVIVDHETVATNRPVRIFDAMYLVTEIDPAAKLLKLQPLDIPLAGAILGRRAPEFWYETVDGQIVSNKTILGKVTILDVWAVT